MKILRLRMRLDLFSNGEREVKFVELKDQDSLFLDLKTGINRMHITVLDVDLMPDVNGGKS